VIDPTATIHPSSVIEEGAVIGARVHIGPFCFIGANVEIGEGTVLKSHVVVNGHTHIGKDNQIYQFASIGEVNQDLKYAGEPTRVEIGDRNRIRESVTIHQWCTIGAHVMVGGCSGVAQDVPPYVIAQGNHATPFGINIEGLKRRGFSKESLHAIRNAYKLLYRSGRTLEEVKPEIEALAQQHSEVQPFYDFFARSTRGLIR